MTRGGRGRYRLRRGSLLMSDHARLAEVLLSLRPRDVLEIRVEGAGWVLIRRVQVLSA